MRFVLPVFAKLNLTLRVVGRRDDGYHNLVSAFVRVPSAEVLYITPPEEESGCSGGDEITISSSEIVIEGENILQKTLNLARARGVKIPPLRIEIVKSLFPGSGLGAGSGNAASLLKWLAVRDPDFGWMDLAKTIGADVPFLFSGFSSALVTQIGEALEPLSPLLLKGVVIFPDWSVGTGGAYESLDLACGGRYPLSELESVIELKRVYGALRAGEKVGLLPNDFAPPLMDRFKGYQELFDLFEDWGCLGWGITGSGGAAFALFRSMRQSVWPSWIRQVLPFPPLL